MAGGWPYPTPAALREAAASAFDELGREDWLEAFAAHARIGEPRVGDARGATEQAGMSGAVASELRELARLNSEYEARFGHVFLICASGLDASQMLAALRERIGNDAATEFELATAEQRKITALRLRDRFGS
jgi:2-oxo-4-hydroxy-4-carboxy-5-ureidoimidazoline decarboxylase